MDTTEVNKTFSGMIDAAKDYSEPLNTAGKEMIERYSVTSFSPFAKQSTGHGEKWRPLAPSTLLARERRWGHYKRKPITTNKILIWTGDMMHGFFKITEKFKLTIDNKIDYFKHNQNTQRKMLYLDDSVMNILLRHLIKYTKRSIK